MKQAEKTKNRRHHRVRTDHSGFLRRLLELALAALGAALGWRGLVVGAAVGGGYALAMRWCVHALGGVSGDLAGFSLTVSELCGLVALAILR